MISPSSQSPSSVCMSTMNLMDLSIGSRHGYLAYNRAATAQEV